MENYNLNTEVPEANLFTRVNISESANSLGTFRINGDISLAIGL